MTACVRVRVRACAVVYICERACLCVFVSVSVHMHWVIKPLADWHRAQGMEALKRDLLGDRQS